MRSFGIAGVSEGYICQKFSTKTQGYPSEPGTAIEMNNFSELVFKPQN
jgi:hypothetical protein